MNSSLISIHPGLMNAHDLNNHCTAREDSAGRAGGLAGWQGQTVDGAEERVAAASMMRMYSVG